MRNIRLKASTTHVVLTDDQHPGEYSVWSEHASYPRAATICRAMGRNGAQGHTVVVARGELASYCIAGGAA